MMAVLAFLATIGAVAVGAAFFTTKAERERPKFKPTREDRYVITCRDFRRATVRWPCHRCGTLTTIVCDRCDWPVCPECRGTHEGPSEAHPFGLDACRVCHINKENES